MDSAAGHGAKPRRRGPSNLDRVITRARTLKASRRFRDELADVRRRWDQEFPDYAIGTPGMPPQTIKTIQYVPMPRSLLDDFNRWRDWHPVDPADAEEYADLYHRFGSPSDAWRDLVMRLCDDGWPPADFPHGVGRFHHPAMAFVGCCLLYEPLLVAEELILDYVLEPVRFPHHPDDHDKDPWFAEWLAKAEVLETALRRAIADDRAMGVEEMAAVVERSSRAGMDAHTARMGGDFHNMDKGWWCVPLQPEMTSLDWREAERAVLDTVHRIYGHDFVGDRVRHWAEQGLSRSKIAVRLGISLKTVSSHLDAAARDTPPASS